MGDAIPSWDNLHVAARTLAALAGKYIGETEKNLSRVLDAVEGHRAILLFDEADALFGKRSGVEDAHDRYANAEASYLLQRLEAGGGITILMMKDDSFIDGAYLRRLTACIRLADADD